MLNILPTQLGVLILISTTDRVFDLRQVTQSLSNPLYLVYRGPQTLFFLPQKVVVETQVKCVKKVPMKLADTVTQGKIFWDFPL